MSAVPKPTFKKKPRKRLNPVGRVTVRYEVGTRQPFLAALFLTGEHTTDPTKRTVLSGATLSSHCLPKYQGTGIVTIEKRPWKNAPNHFIPEASRLGVWYFADGHCHHEADGGGTQGRWEDAANLVLLSVAAHEAVERRKHR